MNLFYLSIIIYNVAHSLLTIHYLILSLFPSHVPIYTLLFSSILFSRGSLGDRLLSSATGCAMSGMGWLRTW